MFVKQSILLGCLATIATLNAHPSDKVIGNITKEDIQNLLVGATIGAAHGLTNNLFESAETGADNNGLYITTFIAANAVRRTYATGSPFSKSRENLATLWGHGIAQSLAEALDPLDMKIKSSEVKRNTVLFTAVLATLLK